MALITNLDTSCNAIQGNFQGYWLNLDGSVTKKTWLGRVIRRIENYFFNTTLSNISLVFQAVVNSYVRSYNDYTYLQKEVPTDQLIMEGKAVSFVAKFLASHRAHLETFPQLKGYIEGYLNLLPVSPPEKSLEKLSDLNLDTIDPKIKALRAQDAAIPELSDEVMRLKAPQVQIPADDSTDIKELLQRYDALVPKYGLPSRFSVNNFLGIIQTWWSRDQDRATLKAMIRSIKSRDPNRYHAETTREAVYTQTELYLKNCNRHLKDTSIDPVKRWQALFEIIQAAKECVPRWMDEAKKQSDVLSEPMAPVPALILQWKERLFQDWIQLMDPNRRHTNHYLNAVIQKWGNRLGLDSQHVTLDIYKDGLQETEFMPIKKMVRQKWKEGAVQAFKERINLSYNQKIHDFLVAAIAKAGISNPTDFVAKEYYDQSGNIKDVGVVRLLREILIGPSLIESTNLQPA